ncbi:MAG: flagellar protein FlaG [Thioalkalispiraceae bacterium]
MAPTEQELSVKERLSEVRTATAEQMQVSREAFDKVVSELKAYVQNSQRNLDFHVDDRTGRVVVQVVDATNDSVIRQIPSEEMIALAHRLQDFMEQNQQDMKGMFLEIKA